MRHDDKIVSKFELRGHSSWHQYSFSSASVGPSCSYSIAFVCSAAVELQKSSNTKSIDKVEHIMLYIL